MSTIEQWDLWRDGQEVRLKLVAEVNGSEVFTGEYFSVDSLEEELRKPEGAIDEALDQMFDEHVEELQDVRTS